MVLALEVAEYFDAGFEPRDEEVVERDKADEGAEGFGGDGQDPFSDATVFGRGWAVAVGSDIVADPFRAFEEKLAFLGVKGKPVLDEDSADAFEKT